MKTLEIARKAPLRFVLLAALAAGLAAVVAATIRPPSYDVSLAFSVDQSPRAVSADYDYDGYYSLKASELFTDTLIGWFATPSVVSEMYERAGLPIDDDDASDAPRLFRPKRFSSQSVVVRFQVLSKEAGAKMAGGIVAIVEEKTESMNQDETGQPLFHVAAAEPVISSARVTSDKAALAGILAGAFLAAATLFFISNEKSPS